jgi:A/G-specific adenine glycosylase
MTLREIQPDSLEPLTRYYSMDAPAALLLDWFSRHARALPWRMSYDPYEILVAEFMSQQTRIETALPYFERWVARYPDLNALAEADAAEAEKLWEGLGYYSRCRNLLSAARAMVGDGHEKPPSSIEALSRYPGIGPYTAGAVASIGYNVAAPAVDGNAERVMSRLFDIEKTAGSSALRKLTAEKIIEMMPEGEARFFNQALMELGALVCLPQKPLCPDCPWGKGCLARARGVETARPLPKARPAVKKIPAWGALFTINGACLLRRRPSAGLWAGFWEIPWFPRETENTLDEIPAWGQKQNLGIECLSCAEAGVARFSFTSHRVTARFVICESRFSGADPLPENWGLHSSESLYRLTLPASSRKFLKLLAWGHGP